MMSAATTQFTSKPDPCTSTGTDIVRLLTTASDTKPEVETVPKPEVLITEQRKQISTQSQWLYLCFGGKCFTRVYAMQTSPDARRFLTHKTPKWRTDGSSYNFAMENDIKVARLRSRCYLFPLLSFRWLKYFQFWELFLLPVCT